MTQGIIKLFQHQVAWPLLESHIKNLAESHWCLSRGSWGPVDILVAATVLAAYSVFRVPV